MSDGDIADGIQGRLAGAIKQFDSADVLTESQIDEYATELADEFEAAVRARTSNYVQDELEG